MPDRNNRVRRFIWLALTVIAMLGAFVWAVRRQSPDPAQQRGGRFGLGAPMAVNVATAIRGDMPVRLMALGTITPLATATVKTQVSGQLLQVAFSEGQMVRKGDFLAQIDPRPYQNVLDEAQGNLARDQAQLANAQLDVKRYSDLVARNSISEQQLATQQALVQQFMGTVATDRALVAAARLNVEYAHVTAPLSGRAGLRQVDVGNYVTAADTNGIVVITQLQPISVIFPIPEDSVPALMRRVQTGAKLEVQAFDRSNTTLLATGVLQTIDNELDTTTGTLKLRALFDNHDGQLFPNQFVNVRLLLDTLHDQVIVPAAAIQKGSINGNATSFVYVVNGAAGTVSTRAVTTGGTDGDRVAVMQGLASGDVVVTEGGDRLRDGAKVQLPGGARAGSGIGGPTARHRRNNRGNGGQGG